MPARQATVLIDSVSPVGAYTPWFIGQIYINVATSSVYVSNGLENTNWTLIYSPIP